MTKYKDLAKMDTKDRICRDCMAYSAWAKRKNGGKGRFEDEPVVWSKKHDCPHLHWVRNKDAEILAENMTNTPSLPSAMVNAATQQLPRERSA